MGSTILAVSRGSWSRPLVGASLSVGRATTAPSTPVVCGGRRGFGRGRGDVFRQGDLGIDVEDILKEVLDNKLFLDGDGKFSRV